MLRAIRDLIVYYDHIAWYYLNTQWHNSFLDFVMPFLRNQWFWAPLYLFLLLFMPAKFRLKGWIWCAGFLMAFALSDQLSAHLMKPYFHRLRPCNNPYLASIIHNIVPCGSGYSFPSSHASNHFALAIFSAVTLASQVKWIWPVAIIWAGLVAYAQVYVGVHFPFDVTCGAILGSIVGIIIGKVFNKYFSFSKLPALPTSSTAI